MVPIRPHQNPLPQNYTTPPLPHVRCRSTTCTSPPPPASCTSTNLDIPITVSLLNSCFLSATQDPLYADEGSKTVYPTLYTCHENEERSTFWKYFLHCHNGRAPEEEW
ncbi:hypothetical protein VNO80_25083 [Phaseolus coccineus]|uniref:Uncharacterized protein n=1 Tax=Phaseolus coccineus TaxID=3886 RepID=A0AAN9QLM3_PHACN